MVIDRRIGAFLIDLAIISALTLMAFGAVAQADFTEFDGLSAAEQHCDEREGDGLCLPSADGALVLQFSRMASPLLFHSCLWLLRGVMEGVLGWTPGKRATGVRVVDVGGEKIGAARGLVRAVLLIVDGFPWGAPMLVGMTVASNTQRQQRVGDLLAGSYVVHHAAAGSFITQAVAIDTPLPPERPAPASSPGAGTAAPDLGAPGLGLTAPATPPLTSHPPTTPTSSLRPGPVVMPSEPPVAAPQPPPPASPAAPDRPQGMSFDEVRQAWVWVEGTKVLTWDDHSGIWRESTP